MNSPKTFFVSGGMSGLGKALAAEYLKRGADVAIFDLQRDEDVLEALRLCTVNAGQKLVAYEASVTDFEQLSSAIEQAVDAIGVPRMAVNCAGIQRAQPFEELPREHFEEVVQVNLFGSRNFADAVLPKMLPGSRLALVASMAGFVANYSYAAYCSSKFAVIGLGKVLRLEYKPRAIGISLICPPEVDTPMVVDEMKSMHPVSRALKNIGGSLSVEEAMVGILAGLDAGRGVIIPGHKAKLTHFCNRYLPEWMMNGVVDRIVRSVLAKMPSAGNGQAIGPQ